MLAVSLWVQFTNALEATVSYASQTAIALGVQLSHPVSAATTNENSNYVLKTANTYYRNNPYSHIVKIQS